MRILPALLAIAATGLLAACETQSAHRPQEVQQSNLDAARMVMAADPARRQLLIKECRNDARKKTALETNNMATLMKVPPARGPEVFCDRVIGAIMSGRLTAADMNSVSRGEITPKVLAVLQGE